MCSNHHTDNEKIVVFGFGAQGSAQAMNLCDSGRPVEICLLPESRRKAEAIDAGFSPSFDAAKSAQRADIAAMLVPDASHPALYNDTLAQNLPKGAALVFAHGFAVHYKQILPRPDLDVILVAPLAQGATVRSDFVSGGGIPCLIAIHQDASGCAKERALSYAKGISKTGPFIVSTFAEEVESDLFAEQAILCGGMPELVRSSFETLVAAGYNPDIAYFCCLRELHAIVALMDKFGLAGMRERISDTALYGALTRGRRIIDDGARKRLKKILDEIRSGKFADEIISNPDKAKKITTDQSKKDTEHLIEMIHRKYRV